jgi:hypothetical protein
LINLYSFYSPIQIDQKKVLHEPNLDGDLESFEMKSKTTLDGLLFIGSKISAAVPLLIVLKFAPKQFWFKIAAERFLKLALL